MSPVPGRVVIEARAKLNLGLAVGPARPDGFHEVASFYQSISLADTLVAARRARGFALHVRHESAAARGRTRPSRSGVVPAGPANLVIRAARAFAVHTGLEGGATFRLVKRIPARAGLGGGSADAAAALVALSRLYPHAISRDALATLAAEIGSDVPFALRGGTAAGFGRGELLRPLRLTRPFRAIVVVPSWRVSTREAFARVDRHKYGLTVWRAKLRFGQSIGRKRLSADDTVRFGNTFEMALGEHRPQFESLTQRLRDVGIRTPRLTGSGSAVFGVVPPGVSAARVAGRFVGDEGLYIVRSVGAGLRLGKRF